MHDISSWRTISSNGRPLYRKGGTERVSPGNKFEHGCSSYCHRLRPRRLISYVSGNAPERARARPLLPEALASSQCSQGRSSELAAARSSSKRCRRCLLQRFISSLKNGSEAGPEVHDQHCSMQHLFFWPAYNKIIVCAQDASFASLQAVLVCTLITGRSFPTTVLQDPLSPDLWFCAFIISAITW